MTKTISATAAKSKLGSLLKAVESGESVIIENRREPVGVLVSVEAYSDYQRLREGERQRAALERSGELSKSLAERNADLSPEDIERISLEVGNEVRERLNKQYRGDEQ